MKTNKTCKDYIAEYEKSTIVVNFGKPADVRYMRREVWIFHKFLDDNDVYPFTNEMSQVLCELVCFDKDLFNIVLQGMAITNEHLLKNGDISKLYYD